MQPLSDVPIMACRVERILYSLKIVLPFPDDGNFN